MSDLTCSGCLQPGLQVVLSLGKIPLANSLLDGSQLSEPEPRYPLDLAFCPSCSLVQITEQIPPEELFAEYLYFSSQSDTMVAHAGALVRRLIDERRLSDDALVIEIASNDGYLLQHYVTAGVPVLGIDPARNVAETAIARGIPTLVDFFGCRLAGELRAEGRRADVIHANNVLAHVPDVNGVVAGMGHVLKDDGVAVIETPYVRDLVERTEFDTIYHEHLYYYSVASLRAIFNRNSMELVRVERIPMHGGSLRAFGAPPGTGPDETVERLLEEEDELGVAGFDYYRDLAVRVDDLRGRLCDLLASLKADGRSIAAYGAAAKGTVLLNAFEIGSDVLDFVADRSPHKQGRYMPGVHLPILPPEALAERMPDDVLLLTWNFADEILAQQAGYIARGGRFIVPVPEPRFVR